VRESVGTVASREKRVERNKGRGRELARRGEAEEGEETRSRRVSGWEIETEI
jgi:hypothetical protein